MPNAKDKGSSAERELLHILVGAGFAVVRAAGSGSTSVDACDLVAGKDGKAFAIEVKACAGKKQYIQTAQMQELLRFAAAFGATPLVAVKWTRRGWSIIDAASIKPTGKLHGVSQDEATPLMNWVSSITL